MPPPTKRRAPDLAAVIGDNLAPVVGVFLLQWKAAHLVVLYFAGFMLDIAGCMVLLLMFDPERRTVMAPAGTPASRVKPALGLALGVCALLLVFGLVFGIPLFAMLQGDPDLTVEKLAADEGLRIALALHLLLAARGYVHAYRGFARRAREDASFQIAVPVRKRFAYVTSRWVVVFVASFLLAIPAVLVIAYCAASVYYEIKAPA